MDILPMRYHRRNARAPLTNLSVFVSNEEGRYPENCP
jgi:hypothetical protein